MSTRHNPSPLLGAGQPPPPPASEVEVPHGHHQPPLPALPAQPPPGEALLQLAMQAEMGGHPVAMGQGQPMYDHNGQPVEQGMHPLAYGGGRLHYVGWDWCLRVQAGSCGRWSTPLSAQLDCPV